MQAPTLPQIEQFAFNYNPLTFDAARNQVNSQLDPIYARALENIRSQSYQSQLDSGSVAAARGLSHSGLAADALNKINIATQGQIRDTEAERSAKASEMAQGLVDRDFDKNTTLRNQAYQEYMGRVNQQYQDYDYRYKLYQDQLAEQERKARARQQQVKTKTTNDWANQVVNAHVKEQQQAQNAQMSRSSLGSYWYDRGNPRIATPSNTTKKADPWQGKNIPKWY